MDGYETQLSTDEDLDHTYQSNSEGYDDAEDTNQSEDASTTWGDFPPIREESYESDPSQTQPVSYFGLAENEEDRQLLLLSSEFEEKETLIQSLTQNMNEYKEQILMLQHQVEDKEKKIKLVENEYEATIVSVREYEDEITAKNTELSALRQSLKDEKQQTVYFEELLVCMEDKWEREREKLIKKQKAMEEELQEQKKRRDNRIFVEEESINEVAEVSNVSASKINYSNNEQREPNPDEQEDLMQNIVSLLQRNKELEDELVECKENHSIAMKGKTEAVDMFQSKWEDAIAENEQLTIDINRLCCKVEELESRNQNVASPEKETGENVELNTVIGGKISSLQSKVDEHIDNLLELASENRKLKKLLLSEQEQNAELNSKLSKVWAMYDETYVQLMESEAEKSHLRKNSITANVNNENDVCCCQKTRPPHYSKFLHMESSDDTLMLKDLENKDILSEESLAYSRRTALYQAYYPPDISRDEDMSITRFEDAPLAKKESSKPFQMGTQALFYLLSFILGIKLKNEDDNMNLTDDTTTEKLNNGVFIPGAKEVVSLAGLSIVVLVSILTGSKETVLLPIILPILIMLYACYLLVNTLRPNASRCQKCDKQKNQPKQSSSEVKDCDATQIAESLHKGSLHQSASITDNVAGVATNEFSQINTEDSLQETEIKAVKQIEDLREQKETALQQLEMAVSNKDVPVLTSKGVDSNDEAKSNSDNANALDLFELRLVGYIPFVFFALFFMFPILALTSLYFNIFVQFWNGWGLLFYYATLFTFFTIICKERYQYFSLQSSHQKILKDRDTFERELTVNSFDIQEMAILLRKEQKTVVKQRKAISLLETQIENERSFKVDALPEVDGQSSSMVISPNKREQANIEGAIKTNVSNYDGPIPTSVPCSTQRRESSPGSNQGDFESKNFESQRTGETKVVNYIMFISAASIPSLPVVYCGYYLSMTLPIIFAAALVACVSAFRKVVQGRCISWHRFFPFLENKAILEEKSMLLLVPTCILVVASSSFLAASLVTGITHNILTTIFHAFLSMMLLVLAAKLFREDENSSKLRNSITLYQSRYEKETTFSKLLKEEIRSLLYRLDAQKSYIDGLEDQHKLTNGKIKEIEEKDSIIYKTKLGTLQKELDSITKERDDLVIANIELFEKSRKVKKELANAEIKLLHLSESSKPESTVVFENTSKDAVKGDTNMILADETVYKTEISSSENVQSGNDSSDLDENISYTLEDLAKENRELSSRLESEVENSKSKCLEIEALNSEISKQKNENEGWKIQRDMVQRALEAYKQKEVKSRTIEEENYKLQGDIAVANALKSAIESDLFVEKERVRELATNLDTLQLELQRFKSLSSELQLCREQNKAFLVEIDGLLKERKRYQETLWEQEIKAARFEQIEKEKEELKEKLRKLKSDQDETDFDVVDLEQYRYTPSLQLSSLFTDENSDETEKKDDVSCQEACTGDGDSISIMPTVKGGQTLNIENPEYDSNLIKDCSEKDDISNDGTERPRQTFLIEKCVDDKSATGVRKVGEASSPVVSTGRVQSELSDDGLWDTKRSSKDPAMETDTATEHLESTEYIKNEQTGAEQYCVTEDSEEESNPKKLKNYPESPRHGNLAAELAEADYRSNTQSVDKTSTTEENDEEDTDLKQTLTPFNDFKEYEIEQLTKMLTDLTESEAKVKSMMKYKEDKLDFDIDDTTITYVCANCQNLPFLAQEISEISFFSGLEEQNLKSIKDCNVNDLTNQVNDVRKKIEANKASFDERVAFFEREIADSKASVGKLTDEMKSEKQFREKLINDFEAEYVGLESAMSKECGRIKEKLQSERTIRGDMITDYEKEIEVLKLQQDKECRELKEQLRQENFQREEALKRGQRLYYQIHTLESELENLRKQRQADISRDYLDIQQLISSDEAIQEGDLKELLENKLKEYENIKSTLEADFEAKDKVSQDKIQKLQNEVETLKLLLEEKEADLSEIEQNKQFLNDQNTTLLRKMNQIEEEIRTNIEVVKDIEESESLSESDNDGILENLGSSSDDSAWENPATNAIVSVMRSSPGHGHPSDVLEKRPLPCSTDDREDSWFKIDFGSKMAVLPRAYSLRHGWLSSEGCLRSWVIEGSPDGIKWVVIRKHVHDTALDARYKKVSWAITDVYKPFRFLRVRQTGENSSGTNELYLSGFEVYGKLIRTN